MKKKKGRIGSSFDDFLKEDEIYEEVIRLGNQTASHPTVGRTCLARTQIHDPKLPQSTHGGGSEDLG